MKRFPALLLISILLLLPSLCLAQGAHRLSQVLVKGNGITANVSPYAKVLVCVANTGCKTAANIYLDAGLTTPAPNPITADGSGNYDYYISSGCVDESITNPGSASVFLPNVCPFNGTSGGGGLNPGINTQIVNYPSNGSTGGPTQITTDTATRSNLNVPRVFTGQVTNGGVNTDTYGGIANTFASADCSGNCLAIRPATSTSSEVAPLPPVGSELWDQYASKNLFIWHDPVLTTNAYTPCNNLVTSNCQSVLFDVTPASSHNTQDAEYRSHTWSDPGCWDYGNAFNVTSSSWCVQHGMVRYTTINNRGIGQNQVSTFFKPATGDAATFAYSYGSADGGARDTSHEGITGFSMQTGQTASYFHGTAGTGATAGTQSLPIVYNSGISTVNRNATTDGGNMLDITQGTVSGAVTGTPTAISGMGWAYSLPVSGTGVVESTAWAAMPCELTGPVPPQTPVSKTCTFTGIQGTANAFTVGVARINGQFPEQVNITAVGVASGGTQSVTFTYLYPNKASLSSLWQSGTQGYLSYDQALATNGFRTNEIVLGAVDSTHLAIEAGYGGGTPSTFFYPAISLLNLSKSGTTVTASVTGGTGPYQYLNRLASALISGCSDSSLNGTVSNVAVNNLVTTGQITWTQSGGGVSCPTAAISTPGFSGFHIYPGAEVRSPSVAGSTTPVLLEPNAVNWTPTDTIEEPLPSFTATTLTRFTHTVMNDLDQSSNARGATVAFNGAGISGSYTPFYWWNQNPCSYYFGCGGNLGASPWLTMQGPNAGALSLLEEPLQGKAVFSIGCPDAGVGGCNGTQLLTLFGISDGGGNITWNPATHELGNVNYNAGGGYIKGFSGSVGSTVTLGGSSSQLSSVVYTRDGATQANAISLCNHFSTTNNELSVGNCNFGTNGGGNTVVAPDGTLDAGILTAQSSATFAQASAGLALPIWAPTGLTYTGTAGTTVRDYYFTAMSPQGIEGPAFRAVLARASTTQATLDSSDYVTVPCPTALQFGYPAGTTYIAWTTNVTAGNVRRLGNCPLTTSIKDDGTVTATSTVATNNWTSTIGAGQFFANAGGGIGAYATTFATSADSWISRLGVNSWGMGSAIGAHDGTFRTANGVFDTSLTVAGQNVCQANGTNCPAGSVTSLTTTGTSGAATLTSGVLNIPNYTYTLPQATTSVLGGVKCDGTTILCTSGVISAVGGGSGNTTSTSLTTNTLPKANGANSIVNSLLSDDGTTATYTGTGGIKAAAFIGTGTTPPALSLPAGTGSNPGLPANSGGFIAPVTGGTAYVIKLPATITAGIPHYAAPALGDGVNESVMTVSAISLTADVSGLLPNANLANSSTTVNGVTCTLGSTCSITSTAAPAAFTTLTDSSSVTWAAGAVALANATLTMVHTTSTRAVNITGMTSGTNGVLVIKQDSTGGAGLTLGTGCTWYIGGSTGFVASTTPTLTTTANAINILAFTYDGTNCYANVR